MNLNELNPLMLDITVNKTAKADSPSFSFGKRTVACYELERIGSSYGLMILDGKKHTLAEHDVFLRKPGQTVEGIMPYRFQYLTFFIHAETEEIALFLHTLPDKVNLSGNPQVAGIFDELQRLYVSGKDTAALLIKARILELLFILSEHSTQSGYTRHIRQALHFMEAQYAKDIGAADIAGYANISVRYLFRQFQEAFSATPMAYLSQIRLEKSKTLLLDTGLSVSEIAAACGYHSASYFDFAFKKYTGLSPREFKKRYILSQPAFPSYL